MSATIGTGEPGDDVGQALGRRPSLQVQRTMSAPAACQA